MANSFATSVASRSLTLKQAMCIASVMEFAGAMLVGSRVTDTIRTKVISIELFESDPSVLMLGMVCAIAGSATYLTIATKFTMPVSTTHSIMGVGLSRVYRRSLLPGVLHLVSPGVSVPSYSSLRSTVSCAGETLSSGHSLWFLSTSSSLHSYWLS